MKDYKLAQAIMDLLENQATNDPNEYVNFSFLSQIITELGDHFGVEPSSVLERYLHNMGNYYRRSAQMVNVIGTEEALADENSNQD